jgi:hypothetical protein
VLERHAGLEQRDGVAGERPTAPRQVPCDSHHDCPLVARQAPRNATKPDLAVQRTSCSSVNWMKKEFAFKRLPS